MSKYKCVVCEKPNMLSQLRCTSCGALHDKNFELQKFELSLRHAQIDELLSTVCVTEEELVNVLNPTNKEQTEEQVEKLIEKGKLELGFLIYTWKKL